MLIATESSYVRTLEGRFAPRRVHPPTEVGAIRRGAVPPAGRLGLNDPPTESRWHQDLVRTSG